MAVLACLLSAVCSNVLANDSPNVEQAEEVSEIIVTATRLDQAARSVPAAMQRCVRDDRGTTAHAERLALRRGARARCPVFSFRIALALHRT